MQMNTMMSATKREQEIDRQNMASEQRTMSDHENNLAEVQEQLAQATSKLAASEHHGPTRLPRLLFILV
jgi:hypothetical protein